MHADHIQDLQLSGLDDASNLWLLDADVNMGLGRQIWQQIKNLPDEEGFAGVRKASPGEGLVFGAGKR